MMTAPLINEERRQNQRFKTRPNVNIVFQADGIKIGNLVNLSRGGLAFQYENVKRRIQPVFSGSFLCSQDEYVYNLPFTLLSDFKVTDNGQQNIRQCGIQFGPMSTEQMIRLDSFIWNNIEF